MAMKRIKDILSDLIRIDSTTSLSNEPIVEYVESRFKDSDVSCHRLKTDYEGKWNLLLMKGPTCENHLGLTLCGHVDTVPAVKKRWKTDPFELTEQNGCWFARGSCDMKGFDAIAIDAIEQTEDLLKPLAVLLTCDEEIGSFGANKIARDGVGIEIPNQVIIGEPTSLQVVRMHKGHISLQLTINGVSAHTGSPHLGKNTAIVAAKVITALHDLAEQMKGERPESSESFSPEANFPVLTVATIECGSAINIVPDLCTIGIGLRLFPHQDMDVEIARIASAVEGTCLLPFELAVLGENPTMYTRQDAPINAWLASHLKQEHSSGVSFGTDGGYLSRAQFDCVLYGPGDIAVAHKPDEFVPIHEIESCALTISRAIESFCKET